MSPKVMIWCSVLLSAIAQMLLKHGLSEVRPKKGSYLLGVVLQKYIWFWGICFAVAMGLWLVALQRVDLSYAYPLVSIGYIIVLILSATLFREQVDGRRWLGVAVICAGVVLIAGS